MRSKPVTKLLCFTEIPGETIEFSRLPLFHTSSIFVSVGLFSVTIQMSGLWSDHVPRWFRDGAMINLEVAYESYPSGHDSSAHYGLKLKLNWLTF